MRIVQGTMPPPNEKNKIPDTNGIKSDIAKSSDERSKIACLRKLNKRQVTII